MPYMPYFGVLSQTTTAVKVVNPTIHSPYSWNNSKVDRGTG